MSPRKRQRYTEGEKPPTIKEVAEHAGVSTATVSRVLSGQQVVSDELIQRVHDSVNALAYRPNRTARSLRKRATQIIGVVVPDVQDPFFQNLIQGIEKVMEEADYAMLLCNTGGDVRREMVHLSTFRTEGVAGVMLAMPRGDGDSLRQFARIGPPMVSIDHLIDRANVDSVRMNHAAGVGSAVDYLLGKGYSHLAFIGGPAHVTSCTERKQGFRAAVEKAGLAVNESLFVTSNLRQEGGYQAMQTLLSQSPSSQAVIAGNHLMALGALQALCERGMKCPDEQALISFGDSSWSQMLQTPLSVIAEPAQEMGETAARLLLERIASPRMASRQVVLDPHLVLRVSA